MDQTASKKLAGEMLEPTETISTGQIEPTNELRREFKSRHISMFSIACAIGTGLIIGSGTALTRGGPGSVLIAYILIGITVFFVMTGLGEMAAFLPMKKGFGGYATRMVDPAFGYVLRTIGVDRSWRLHNFNSYLCVALPLGGITSSSILSPPQPT